MSDYITDEDGNVLGELTRCRGCNRMHPKGFAYDEFVNVAERENCGLRNDWDMNWDYVAYWYVDPDSDYCSSAERKED